MELLESLDLRAKVESQVLLGQWENRDLQDNQAIQDGRVNKVKKDLWDQQVPQENQEEWDRQVYQDSQANGDYREFR